MGFGSLKNHPMFRVVWVDLGLSVHKWPAPYSTGMNYKAYCRLCEIAKKTPLTWKEINGQEG